jgi:phosphoserine phosphatase
MREIVLIKVSGEDKPGITSSVMDILGRYNVHVLDISQAVVQDALTLGVLVEIPPDHKNAPVFKDLLYRANDEGVKVKFTPVSEESYEAWAKAPSAQRFIVTMLAREITAHHVGRLTRILAESGLNIESITRLSDRAPLTGEGDVKRACIEIAVRGEHTDQPGLRRKFLDLSMEIGVDIAFQEDDVFRRNRRLVAFDMDSTLIQAEFIDELAKAHGVGEEVSAVTAAAMRGEIDFRESLTRRVKLLAGLDAESMERVSQTIKLTEGARRLISNLKAQGYKIAILSGGFTYIGKRLQDSLGIDFLHANQLEIENGKLTGGLVGDIVDGAKKAELLGEIAQREGFFLSQVVAVGDGANDLPMLEIAGLGIAFHAKPKVKEGAEQSISSLGLDGILYLLGMRDREALA